jgi:cytochrome c oxidase subunit 3
MWVFLVTEIMFFGGLLTAYTVYRSLHPAAFEAGSRLIELKFGAMNTAVLICSSLTMALAIRAAQAGKRKAEVICYLVVTMLLGAAFLYIKFVFEWHRDYIEGLTPGFGFSYHGPYASGVQMFFCFYFFLTGLHALHMIIVLRLWPRAAASVHNITRRLKSAASTGTSWISSGFSSSRFFI